MLVARGGICAGVVVLVIGTFLPWLRSGRTERNSYASDAAFRRLLDVHGAVAALLHAWPFVGLAGALGAALVLVGWLRVGAGLAAVTAACAGGVAIWALTREASGLIRPATIGPVVTLSGAILTCLAVLACCALPSRTTGRVR
jgi:hypothetical protein